LGDRWSLIVIRDLMFGNRRHFRELLTRLEEQVSSNILANRQTRLEKAGLVSRRDDPSHKQKVIYSLTEASIDLVPLLARWAVGARVTHPRRRSSPYAQKSSRTEARSCGPSSRKNCDTFTWRRPAPSGTVLSRLESAYEAAIANPPA